MVRDPGEQEWAERERLGEATHAAKALSLGLPNHPQEGGAHGKSLWGKITDLGRSMFQGRHSSCGPFLDAPVSRRCPEGKGRGGGAGMGAVVGLARPGFARTLFRLSYGFFPARLRKPGVGA